MQILLLPPSSEVSTCVIADVMPGSRPPSHVGKKDLNLKLGNAKQKRHQYNCKQLPRSCLQHCWGSWLLQPNCRAIKALRPKDGRADKALRGDATIQEPRQHNMLLGTSWVSIVVCRPEQGHFVSVSMMFGISQHQAARKQCVMFAVL